MEVMPLHARQKNSLLVLFEPVPRRGGWKRAAEPRRTRRPRTTPGSPDRPPETANLPTRSSGFWPPSKSTRSPGKKARTRTEEALSTNEELQSLNEELETAKEELQSTNEELITVNDELQAKNAALAQARDFAMSIVETVRQPLLVLDMELRIRMANRAFYRTVSSVARWKPKAGRFIRSRDGPWDIPGLRAELEVLLQGGISFPDVEIEQDFPGVGRKSPGGGRHAASIISR